MLVLLAVLACGPQSSDPAGRDSLPVDTVRTDTARDSGAPVDTSTYVPPTAGPTYTFTFMGGGWEPYAGKRMGLALAWEHAPEITAWTGELVVPASGRVEGTFPDVLVEGGEYLLYVYVDLDDDGQCDDVPIDHVWSTERAGTFGGLSIDIGPITEDLVVTIPANTAYDHDGCSGF